MYIAIPSNRQSGITLIVTLIILLVLTLLAITSIRNASIQEHMAGNAHDQLSAFQSAEAALRAGEAYLQQNVVGPFDGNNGLYDASTGTIDWRADTTQWQNISTVSGVAAAPGYYIEQLPADAQNAETLVAGEPTQETRLYRITARGFGLTTDASVVLQSTYRR